MAYPTKRSEERMGHNKVAKDQIPDIDKIEFTGTVRLPAGNPEWSSIAKYLWRGVKNSPMRKYWTETDYGFAWMACEAVDVAVKRGTAMNMQAAEGMMRAALFNEYDRRKARIELTRKTVEEVRDPVVDQNVKDFQARRAAREA